MTLTPHELALDIHSHVSDWEIDFDEFQVSSVGYGSRDASFDVTFEGERMVRVIRIEDSEEF